MKIRILLIALISLALFSFQPKKATKPYFFIQMSDPQFGMYAENKSFEQETVNFEKAIAAANRLHPTFVIICGDLVNKQGDAAQIAEYKRITAKLDPSIPLYSVAGNHDVGNIPTPETILAYRRNIGADHYTFQNGNIFGIVLNSSLIMAPDSAGREAADQESWLKFTLERAKRIPGKNIVVFQHHPWFLEKADEADQYFNIPTVRRKMYLDLFRKYGVKYLFSGHYHRNSLGQFGDIKMITTGPVGKPIGPDPSGIRIVKVNGTEMTDTYYDLNKVPATP